MTLVVVVLSVVASACGGGAPQTASTTLVEAVPETTELDTELLELDSDEAFIATPDVDVDGVPIDPHPVEDEAEWRCDDLTMSLDQLLELESLAPASPAAYESVAQFEELGPIDDWLQLDDAWLVHREMIESEPPALLLGNTVTGGSHPCVPLRATWMRPVAWERVDDLLAAEATIAFEPCVAIDDLVIDVRSVGQDVLLGLFTASGASRSCVVDGSATIQVAAPDGASVLSSQRWPFEPGDPARWFIDTVHSPVAPLDAAALDGIECVAEGSATGIFVQFKGMPAWVDATLYSDGVEWLDHDEQSSLAWRRGVDRAWYDRLEQYGNPPYEGFDFDGGYSYFGAEPGREIDFELRLTVPGGDERSISCGAVAVDLELPSPTCSIVETGGQPRLVVDDGINGLGTVVAFRDGEVVDVGFRFGGLIDTTAQPGVTHEYSVTIVEGLSERESGPVSCGSFTVVDTTDPLEQLLRAQELFDAGAVGAHVYMTVITADGDRIDAALSFVEEGHEFVAPEDPPLATHPFRLHDRLIDAVREGGDVAFEIDSFAGVPTWWAIGDEEFQITCLSVDTAPPELRDITCDPSVDLIGGQR